MQATSQNFLLRITALVEAATGLCLLLMPTVLFAILFGLEHPAIATIFVGRIAGVALLAIGVMSWMARNDKITPALLGLLTGILIYNTGVFIILVFAGLDLETTGILLWPAVGVHVFLAIWCFSCLRSDRRWSRNNSAA